MLVPLTPLMFLNRAVKLYPNKIGVICGQDRFTYRQFHQRIQQLSHVISDVGTQKGDVVAFLSHNCHRLLEAYYGVVQTGAILLPLNIRLSAKDILYILNHSQARILFLEPEFLPLIQSIRDQLPSVRTTIGLEALSDCDWVEPLTYEQKLQQAR